MAWNMQIREIHSYTTIDPEDQNVASPTGSTPTDYGKFRAHLRNHFNMVIGVLETATITPSPPKSPKMMFDRVFIAKPTIVDSCQHHFTWDAFQRNGLWWEDKMVVEWVMSVPHFAVEVHPATSLAHTPTYPQIPNTILPGDPPTMWETVFPSFELPSLDLFTDIRWPLSLYSPSEYSQDDFGFGQGCSYPLGNAAQELMKEIEDTQITYRSLEDVHLVIPKMQALCTELRATVNGAENSPEFDESNSHSDVPMLDLNEIPIPPPATYFYHIAGADGSSELDKSDSNSDVSMLDLDAISAPPPATNIYHIARIEDSVEFDESGTDSGISMLDVDVAPAPAPTPPVTNFYYITRAGGLNNLDPQATQQRR